MRIGYYAHHHGSGHCRQADKLAELLPAKLRRYMTVFTSLPCDNYRFSTITDEQIVHLSAEDELPADILAGRAGNYWQPSSLHYSPVGNCDIQARSWQLLDGIRQRQIDLMIVDVSVEVAMLCRAASVPYLYVRLVGERDDEPHLNAFAGALGLLAPYPKALEAGATPDWVKQKTLYLDFIPDKINAPLSFTAFINKLMTLTADKTVHKRLSSNLANTHKTADTMIVTVIKGYGGHDAIDAKLPTLRDVLPQSIIISLGPIHDDMRAYVDIATHVEDVMPFIASSDLLLMACGLNSVAQVYHHATPLVVLPDARPHREQAVMAEALIAQNRALSWSEFIAQTSHLNSHDIPSFLSINNASISSESISSESISNQNTKSDKTALMNHQSSVAAQHFMDSIANDVSVKAWFQEWLLPRLALKPKT